MVNIFPQGLEGTLVIPIFVGLLVMAVLTETLGWDFIGVVVPGYLASVCLFEPLVAFIVLVEALATWALAVALDRGLTASGVSHPLFGRDRFFLVLVASVAVRITFEGLLLPALVARLGTQFPALSAHRHELFGIGLVLVPLCANRLWNPGLWRGLFQLGTQTLLVAAVLRLVLLPFTNFSLAGFDPTYDPLALAFLTSPRAQMALLITAAVASWLNRRYGWDFHGILVPALLGLAALAPIKLLATVIEAVLIMLISRALLTLPRLRRMNVEGARKVVLCFSVGVVFKMVVARTALAHLPGYRPTDLLGFGYMLPSLLAERIWRSQSVVLVLLPTLQTAAIGFVLTTGAALGLAIAAPAAPPPPVRFATLPQAVLALAPGLRAPDADAALPAAGPDAPAAVAGMPALPPAAETADGYRVFSDPWGQRLIAVKSGGHMALLAPLDEWAGLAATAAARDGATLVLGPDAAAESAARGLGLQPRRLPAPAAARVPLPLVSADGWAALSRRAIEAGAGAGGRGAGGPSDVLRPLVPGAAVQMDRARGVGADLSRAVAPYGLGTTLSADGMQVVQGAHWPLVVLRPAAKVVVAAAYASEWGAAGAAVAVCEALQADCVLAHDDEGLAVPLGQSLAERRGRPLVIVRGTSRSMGSDALVVAAPDLGPGPRPPWLRPLDDLIDGRMSLARQVPAGLGGLRALPLDAGRVSPTALLWFLPAARRMLSGADQKWWAEAEVQDLLKRRRVPVLHADALGWVAAGKGAPSTQALELAESLARTSDVAQLGPKVGAARLSLLVDRNHDLIGFAIEQGARRALVVAGLRREERAVIDRPAVGAVALQRGSRTLLAREVAP